MRNSLLILSFATLCGVLVALGVHLWTLAPNWTTVDYLSAGLGLFAIISFVASLAGKVPLVTEARPGEDNSRFNDSVMPPKFSEHDRPRTAGQTLKKTHH